MGDVWSRKLVCRPRQWRREMQVRIELLRGYSLLDTWLFMYCDFDRGFDDSV
jgi:hypothetical protein